MLRSEPMDIALIGVPFDSAGTATGVARAPAALRAAGLPAALQEAGIAVIDMGDVRLAPSDTTRDPASGIIAPDALLAMIGSVRDAVRAGLAAGALPLVIGGDCPVLLGCLGAIDEGPVGLLFVDGHEDAWPPRESTTGEAADMELALALGMADASWSPELAGLLPLVAPADVRILGARDAEILRAEGVASLRDRVALVDGERLAADPAGIAATACATLPDPWWFHLDLDVLSTQALPAIDYPQPGGLGWDALAAVAITALSADPRGWDVTIYNPDLDPERVHARRIVRFIGSVMERVAKAP
jgi:arginase